MPKADEISSTRRLLQLIRGKPAGKSARRQAEAPAPPAARPVRPPLPGVASGLKKRVNLGVELGNGELRLAAVAIHSEKRRELLSCKRVACDPAILDDRNQFQRYLKTQVSRFCGPARNVRVWCAITSANVETRYLRIPAVRRAQLSNTILWTLRRQVAVDTERQIFDYEILGNVLEDGVQKTEVIAYAAPAAEIQSLRGLFQRSGYALEGISIVPFALQNFFRTGWIEGSSGNICNIFVGRDWSRITIYSGGNLVLSREIKAGVRGVIESLREAAVDPLADSVGLVPGPESELTAEELERLRVMDSNLEAENLIADVLGAGRAPADGFAINLHEEKFFHFIVPALDRIVRQIERTGQHFSLNFDNQAVERLYVSGVLGAFPRIVTYIGSQMDLPTTVLDPFDTLSPVRSKVPPTPVEREAFVPAVGMALSSNQHTPNFIYTYEEKDRAKSVRLMNRAAMGLFLAVMAACIGIYRWQDGSIADKRRQVKLLESEAAIYPMVVTPDMILQAVVRIQARNRRQVAVGQRYLGVSILRELSELTPAGIRLVGVTARLENGAARDAAGDGHRLRLEGIVFGDRPSFDASLGEFVLLLQNSPLFERPTVKATAFEFFENKEVMRFRVQLDLA